MWSRQLSTFERSSMMSGSSICVVSLMASPGSWCYRRTLLTVVRPVLVREVLGKSGRAAGRRRGVAAHELLQPCLEHAALGIEVGPELGEPPSHLGLELSESQVLCGNELLVAAFQLAC